MVYLLEMFSVETSGDECPIMMQADPHPGNMLRTPEGRLAILDFGLMTQVCFGEIILASFLRGSVTLNGDFSQNNTLQVTDDQKYGMIEAISHLVNRDYERIIDDFITLGELLIIHVTNEDCSPL